MSTYLVEEKVDEEFLSGSKRPPLPSLILVPFSPPSAQREAPKWEKGGSLHPLCYEIKIRKGRGGGGEAKKDEPADGKRQACSKRKRRKEKRRFFPCLCILCFMKIPHLRKFKSLRL